MTVNTTPRVWHITGANTGIGLELALKALAEGDRVVAAVRSPEKVPDSLKRDEVRVLKFDLTSDQDAMHQYAKDAIAAFGRVDVLVNNAGYSYMGAIEETTDEYVKLQYDANVFSMLRIIRAFLPHLRTQGSGLIMNLSSIGGLGSNPGVGVYCSTKFAVEAITEALDQEITQFGLHAVIVEPGYFRTAFLSSLSSPAYNAPPMEIYNNGPVEEMRRALVKYNGNQPGDPKKGVARMWEYAAGAGMFEGREKLRRLPLGTDCGNMARGYLKERVDNLDQYEDIWRSTDIQE